MIPQHLSLTNFMCYRQATVDFTGLHVACLSGDNGAGKSTLLDAITWALWGRARARRDDDLVRLGQEEMAVDFAFRLGAETYRVVRRRRVGKRGSSLLDLQVQDNGQWRSLAESNLRATEEKISRLLRLDYDTFINSAFLRQGRADEFTTRPPAERKRVLGDILGLDTWTVYEERAKERLRALNEESRSLDLRLAEIAAELARRPEIEAQVEAARAEAAQAAAALAAAQTAFQEMEAVRAELRHLQERQDELARRLSEAARERTALEQEREERRVRLEEQKGLLARAAEIEAGYAAYQQAVQQEQALSEKLSALTELNDERRRLEQSIADARHDLETRLALAEQRVKDLLARQPPPDLYQEHQDLLARLDYLTQLQASRDAARDDLVRLTEERATLTAQNKALKAEMDALKERIDLLARAEADCPLCGQPLTETHRQRLLQDLETYGKGMGNTYRANRARLDEVATLTARLEEALAQAEGPLRDRPALERKAASLQERLRSWDEASAVLPDAQAEVEHLKADLSAQAYAPDDRAALAALLARAAALGYDAAAHEAARRAVAEGEPFREQKAHLDLARATVEQEEAALVRLEEAIRRQQQQMAELQAQHERQAGEVARLEERLRDAPTVEVALVQARDAEAEARQRLGGAEQRLAACDALAQQQESRLRRRQELARQQSIYEELRAACGVNGVPAMIIEAAVPEIEAEANRLLAQMTNGRMHVRLETQRETQAGEVREALDIRIMDELGERPYENYSGGEQLRVNLALRIALSRLLARRAGAQLQTLIIDEGFGTQDAQGRERLVEAIRTVQDEFACVLVITHLEELQDAFPARIQVTKTPEGSVVDLL